VFMCARSVAWQAGNKEHFLVGGDRVGNERGKEEKGQESE